MGSSEYLLSYFTSFRPPQYKSFIKAVSREMSSKFVPTSSDDLRVFRKRHSLTQKLLAKELGVSHMTVWRWENGYSRIPQIMPVTLRGLRHIFDSRKTTQRRRDRMKMIKEQDKALKLEKALSKMPAKVREQLQSNR